MRKISCIYFNWFYGKEGAEFESAEVGKNNVIKIKEHPARGNGDRFYYDIFYKNGMIKRVFNVNLVDIETVGADDVVYK